MEPITRKIRSFYEQRYLSLSIQSIGLKTAERTTWEHLNASLTKIRSSTGYPVTTFKNLVEIAAQIALWNSHYDLYFRGQEKDYKDKHGKTVIYPSICRPGVSPKGKYKARIKTGTIQRRYQELESFIRHSFNKRSYNFNEAEYAMVQHYEVMPTPLIDITQSLRVAASFALMNSDDGYLYVFGLPYSNGRVSHFIQEEIVLVKLQNVCPVHAYRPRYQEGFLVGRLPFYPKKEAGDNLARRMIGKFKLDNSKGEFWDKDFSPLPRTLLFPEKDTYVQTLKNALEEFRKSSITTP
jgi:hypothetical protein